VATSPRSWVTHLNMGLTYYEKGLPDKAEQEYLQVIKLDRVSPQYKNASSAAYAGLGHIYMAKNMLEKADTQFSKAIAAYPANYPVYVSLGTLYYKQGRLKEAAAMWVEALKYEPKDTDALRNLAILCAEQKDNKAARFYAERLLEAGARVPPDFLVKIRE
jgi:tetratricopeptide (TPR) repeat protein